MFHNFHNDLPFLPERIKIQKTEKIAANLHGKTEYVIHIRNLKQWVSVEKVNRAIKFNQKSWQRPYINMRIDLRKLAKNDYEEGFFKLMDNADMKYVTPEKRRNYLVLGPNY